MNYNLRHALGLESAEIFSPSTIVLEETEVSSEVELVNEVQDVEIASTEVLTSASNIDLVDNSIATLESILLTLEVSLEQHAVNNINYALAFVSLEHIEKQFGLESGYLTVSTEENGEDAAEQAAGGMASKIKGMLADLKGAGAALFDKIAQGIEVVRKDAGKIATRVKQRISALRSSLNKDNKGGADLKTGGLNKLSGISDNSVVTGSSFLSKLESTAFVTSGITNATVKADVLSAYIDSIGDSKQNNIEGLNKVFAQYYDGISHLNKEDLSDKETPKGREGQKSDVLISGHRLVITHLKEDDVRKSVDILLKAAKEIDPKDLNDVSMESEGEDSTEVVEKKGKLTKIKKILDDTYNAINKFWSDGGGSPEYFWTSVRSLLSAWGLVFAAKAIIAYGSAIPLSGLLVLILCGCSIFQSIKTLKYMYKLNKQILTHNPDNSKDNDASSLESFNISMESISNPDALTKALLMGSTEIKFVKEKSSEKVTAKSMSSQEISKACDNLDKIADSVIDFASKTKDRKALIKKYTSAVKGGKDTAGEYEIDLSKLASKFLKNQLSFETDYCRTLCQAMLAGMTYAEASNNATPTDSSASTL